ncbi:ABC transporter substrate-binding protein [Cryobacterium sp. AP23]
MTKTLNPGSLRRRAAPTLASAAILALALSSCSAGGAGDDSADPDATTLTVALGWIPNVEYGGFWLADEKGYFADEGLDIEWVAGGSEAPTVESAVAAGTADIGIAASLRSVMEASNDNDFSIIGSVFQENPGCMLSLAADPIETAEDIVGKKILAQDEATIVSILNVNGLPLDYEFVPTSFDPGPLVAGDGVGYTAYYVNQPVTMNTTYGLEEGSDFICTMYSDLGLPLYASTIFAQAAGIDADPDTYEAFLRAAVKGWTDYQDDPESAATLAVDTYGADLGLDIEQQSIQADRQTSLLTSDITDEHGLLYMDADLLGGAMYEALAASGMEDLPAVDDVLDMSLLDAAATD